MLFPNIHTYVIVQVHTPNIFCVGMSGRGQTSRGCLQVMNVRVKATIAMQNDTESVVDKAVSIGSALDV